MPRNIFTLIPVVAMLVAATAHASNATSPQTLRTHATLHSIGVEWDIEGDANHNATCAVEFRKTGTDDWQPFYHLFRVDYQGWWKERRNLADRHYNMLAGSLMFLSPGTEYEVRLTLDDRDGGSTVATFTITTRAVPAMPTGGRELHVKPGDGGGSGTGDDPFLGFAAADAQAQPGDIFLVSAGDYGVVDLKTAGSKDAPIVWKSTGDGDAVVRGMAVQSHVWLSGLSFITEPNAPILQNERYRNHQQVTGLSSFDRGAQSVLITNCRFRGYSYSIELDDDCAEWYIADNVIIGDKPATPLPAGEAHGQLSGEGIELNHSSGHVVAYNTIAQTADGLSYPQRNCDIYGNDISIVTDDGIEPDYSYANNRMWGNRLTHCSNFFFSFQPMFCGPWYIVRNLSTGSGRAYKFNGPTDQFMTAHNTFVISDGPVVVRASALLTSVSRNNIYVSARGGEMWQGRPWGSVGKNMHENNFTPNWKTDVDYDGFDFGSFRAGDTLFAWDKQTFSDPRDFAAAVGIEQNAVYLKRGHTFEDFKNPAEYLTLKPDSKAVDAGDVLPGINSDYAGEAPDLGAYEVGKPLPHYGVRDDAAMKDHALYWAKW